ncbi:hypothetical protein G6F23_014555 [Rhizopus arrhizus]|nr:hypothetical protein G6F23_014555 [Rhizopus arrhizus]
MRAGIADAPSDGPHASQAGSQTADQVGVVHPGLHGVGTRAGNQAAQGQKAAQADSPPLHAQRVHGNAGRTQAFAVNAFIGQRHHNVRHARFGIRCQAQQHGFRAALPQARDDVQDAHCGGAHRASCTASNSSSHSDSTLASA